MPKSTSEDVQPCGALAGPRRIVPSSLRQVKPYASEELGMRLLRQWLEGAGQGEAPSSQCNTTKRDGEEALRRTVQRGRIAP
jgi:hypothetical protein